MGSVLKIKPDSVICTTRINADKNYRYDSEFLPIEESTITSLTDLYFTGLSLYGKCISKVYIDNINDSGSCHIGYVFQKRERYDDCEETYLAETWLSITNPE